MPDRMVTLKLAPSQANLAAIRKRYGLGPHDGDAGFGVVCVSPQQQLYAILVSEETAQRIEGAPGVAGTFSNPKIETFGPPE